MQIFHASNVVVKHPRVMESGFYKDFGFGFYCTKLQKQAIKWARTKRGKHIINVYSYEKNDALKVLQFADMTEEWLNFIAECRAGKVHDYDIVEGPMADDTVWDYVEDFLDGKISREAFWVLAKFKYPTHQILFCTDKALQTIKFVRSDIV